jgi:RimJ/RimL family protein N-acetyltransferase
MDKTGNLNIWEGEKVRLRAVKADDWELFYENDQDTEAARHSWRIPLPRSPEAAWQWADRLAHSDTDDDNAFRAIESLKGELVGAINTHSCNLRNGTFSYGIGIFRSHWQHGYARDTIRILLRYFFLERRYQKVNVVVYDFNEPSIRLHERLGFSQEGRRRRTIFTGGAYHDEILFGMTREEFHDFENEQR